MLPPSLAGLDQTATVVRPAPLVQGRCSHSSLRMAMLWSMSCLEGLQSGVSLFVGIEKWVKMA